MALQNKGQGFWHISTTKGLILNRVSILPEHTGSLIFLKVRLTSFDYDIIFFWHFCNQAMSGPVLDTVVRSSLLLQGVYALFRARENHLFFLLNRRPRLWKGCEPKDKKIKG